MPTNRLVLGCAQVGLECGIAQNGCVSDEEVKKIFDYANEVDISTLDTAIAYGVSEERLGKLGVQSWKIISKIPPIPEERYNIFEWVNNSLRYSLVRLKVEKLYGFLLHRSGDLLSFNGDKIYDALIRLKREGFIEKIGISIYDPAELEMLCSRYSFDIVQAPFSLFDDRLLKSGWLSELTKRGIEVHVRSIFLQGLLLMKRNERDKRFERWSGLWLDFENWLNQNQLTPLQACLNYVISFPQIHQVIVGIDSLIHLKEIFAVVMEPQNNIQPEFGVSDVALLNPSNWGTL